MSTNTELTARTILKWKECKGLELLPFLHYDDTVGTAVIEMKRSQLGALPIGNCHYNKKKNGWNGISGYISWESLCEEFMLGDITKSTCLKDLNQATSQDIPRIDEEKPISSIMRLVGRRGFCLAEASGGVVKGFISNRNLLDFLRDYLGPIMRISLIEKSLASLLSPFVKMKVRHQAESYPEEDTKCSKLTNWNKPTFADYVNLLGNDECREALNLDNFKFDDLRKDLERLNEIRNDLAHFRRFQISPAEEDLQKRVGKTLTFVCKLSTGEEDPEVI